MILYRKIILGSLVLVSCILFNGKIFSYDTNIAHPHLTEKAIEVFNNSFEIQISNEQKNWIVKGAIEEDTPVRWMNHFYDPVSGRGLWNFSSAKNWAKEDVEQTIYTLGDQTWQKAVSDYAKGDKKSAFVALGHVLHLVEDMSVPAHTRLDAHPEGDPYEQWAKQNAKTDFKTGAIVKFSNLENYFDSLAGYSNKYFLSKDSFKIESLKKLDKIAYVYQDKKYLCLKSDVGQCLILFKKGINGDEYYFDDLVHSDYYSLLAPKAVSYSAGVIDLFFQQAIEAEREFQNKSWFERWKLKVFGSNLNQLAGTGMVADWIEENDVEEIAQGENEESNISNFDENYLSPDFNFSETPNFPNLPNFPNPPDNEISPALTDEMALENTQIAQNQPQNTLILPLGAPNLSETNQSSTKEPEVENNPEIPQFLITLPYAGFGGGGGSSPVLAEEITPFDNQQEDDEDTESVEPEIEIENEDESENEIASSTPPELDIVSPSAPQITFPEDLSQTFNLLEINFSGIAEASSTVFATGGFASTTDFDFGSTTADGSGNWFLILNFEEGTTTLEFFAKDAANNISSSTQIIIFTDDLSNNIIPPDPVELAADRPVVINEIAWAGTGSQTSADEWMELYNRSDENISLEGWVLYSDDNGPYINLAGTIPAKGYYLIERTDDNTVFDISADWVGSFGNGLSNAGEILYLSYASTTIDQTPLCNGNWCAGDSYSYLTMERIDSGIEGTKLGNWSRNNFLIMNGKSAAGAGIHGTPKSRNSANMQVAGNLPYFSSGEILLKKSQSPYVVNNTAQVFQGGSVVRIEPGTVIKFYNDASWKFRQNAKVIAQGTPEEPIIFTSFYDDEYGGDLDKNPGSSGHPRDWYGIRIEDAAEESIFDNTILRYGGKWYSGGAGVDSQANLYVTNSPISVTNSVFEGAVGCGLKLFNSSTTPTVLENNICQNNGESGPDSCGI